MRSVELAALHLGEELGDGGQGKVYALADRPGDVLKRYHDPAIAAGAPHRLAALTEAAGQLHANGRPSGQWAALPHTIVVEGDQCIGFLMQRIPATFMLVVGGRPRPADLSYLAAVPKPVWGDVALPDDAGRVAVLAQYCAVVHALHTAGLVLGDMSFGNVLWSTAPQPSVLLLDCDSISEADGGGPIQFDTLDWDDPLATPGSRADADRDRYKLALAILRVLARELSIRPEHTNTADLRLPESVGRAAVGDLARRAAGPRGTRPTAAEWSSAILNRATVAVARPQVRIRSGPAPKPDLLDGPRVRQTVPVTPPAPGRVRR